MLAPVLFVFLFGILTFIGFAIYQSSYVAFQDSGMLSATGEQVFEDFGAAILMFDWISVLIVAAMIVASTWVLSRGKDKYHPVVYVAAWIMLPFVGFIAFIFNYMFMQFISEEIMYTIALMFPKIMILGTNLHWICFGCFVFSQLFLYSTGRGASSEEV